MADFNVIGGFKFLTIDGPEGFLALPYRHKISRGRTQYQEELHRISASLASPIAQPAFSRHFLPDLPNIGISVALIRFSSLPSASETGAPRGFPAFNKLRNGGLLRIPNKVRLWSTLSDEAQAMKVSRLAFPNKEKK
jgi:hypothetical protein